MSVERAAEPDPLVLELSADLDADSSLAACQQAIARAAEKLTHRFAEGESTSQLVTVQAELADCLLTRIWGRHCQSVDSPVALVAVGGYGRGELHPHSDIDIMVLVDRDCGDAANQAIAGFLAALWDVGLDVGHSVRSLDDCHREARADITVATTLMEARLLAGSETPFKALQALIQADDVWPSREFFAEKRREQTARHHRYDDTAYKLEPNVKGSPGGLRDIQMIGWIARRHFKVASLDELIAHNFITDGQLQVLIDGQEFLWRIRFALHVLTGRREDRMLFDHQTRLAGILGYEDATYTLAVEQLMQRYYRTVMAISRVSEMLLQRFEEEILMDPDAEPVPLNDRFQLKNGYLQTTHGDVFSENPSALLEMFVLLQQHDNVRGVSAATISLIRQNLNLIDEEFRQNPRNHRLFLEVLRAKTGVTHGLRRMNLYGILGLYIPAFGRIVGRMQYDLFHAYTVDQHTLFVVSNLRRFALPRFDQQHPHCSRLMQSFDKPEIVYIAGLFHDIAKGRGGDHSELGAVDAEAFCLEHGLTQYDARIVSWLVRNHLLLSMTAQKKDLSDPDVINEFAATIGDQAHLDFLYVLTVADVKATNPKLWNSWKETLFRDLYEQTTHAFRRGTENPIDRELLIEETQSEALQALEGNPDVAVTDVWALFTEDYFLRYRGAEIAWHTQLLSQRPTQSDPPTSGLLDIRRGLSSESIEAVFYTPRSQQTFAHATALLAQMGMTIVDVRIVPLRNDYSLDMYIFIELHRETEIDQGRLGRIRESLGEIREAAGSPTAMVTRNAPRQVRMFSTQTRVSFDNDTASTRTIIELVAADRPGLLSIVGQVFIEYSVNIDTAKILTIGERAEDVFYVVGDDGKVLSESVCKNLRKRLVAAIDDHAPDDN